MFRIFRRIIRKTRNLSHRYFCEDSGKKYQYFNLQTVCSPIFLATFGLGAFTWAEFNVRSHDDFHKIMEKPLQNIFKMHVLGVGNFTDDFFSFLDTFFFVPSTDLIYVSATRELSVGHILLVTF
jgi:hypothetical protein